MIQCFKGAAVYVALIIPLLLLSGCNVEISDEEYLQSVYDTLNKIKSATYYITGSASAPGDTLSFSPPRHLYIHEFVNPADEHVGAHYIQFSQEDTARIQSFYDGLVQGKFSWEEKTVKIDSFQNYPYPFRLVFFPFFTKTRNIIKYALETEDSIRIDIKDLSDSIQFSLIIYDKAVEFVTQPYVNINPYESSIGKVSQYDIWIRKSDNLPYRLRRKMNHSTSFETCTNVRLNTTRDVKLISTEYFPEDFSITQIKRTIKKKKSKLEGKVAPDWILTDIDGNTVGLSEFKSKVVMIQFTGVGCGPCHASIPFLKQLVNASDINEFEFFAIESWSTNIAGIKRYREINDLNFKFLLGDKSVLGSYEVTGVPVFYILDEKHVIQKVIEGYHKGVTDQEIRDAMITLL